MSLDLDILSQLNVDDSIAGLLLTETCQQMKVTVSGTSIGRLIIII